MKTFHLPNGGQNRQGGGDPWIFLFIFVTNFKQLFFLKYVCRILVLASVGLVSITTSLLFYASLQPSHRIYLYDC